MPKKSNGFQLGRQVIETSYIGDRGELCAHNELIKQRFGDYYFKPSYLGEKYPYLDFFAMAVKENKLANRFAIFQVKSTKNPMKRGMNIYLDNRDDPWYNNINIPFYVILVTRINSATIKGPLCYIQRVINTRKLKFIPNDIINNDKIRKIRDEIIKHG